MPWDCKKLFGTLTAIGIGFAGVASGAGRLSSFFLTVGVAGSDRASSSSETENEVRLEWEVDGLEEE